MMRRAALLAIVCLATGFTGPFAQPLQAEPNLIVNGGFETPVVSGLDDAFGAGSLDITGWLVAAGGVDVCSSGSSVLGDAHSGLQMLDINGFVAGTVEQTFATSPGVEYELSLFYSNNPNPSFSLPSYSGVVIVQGVAELVNAPVTHSGATQADMNWLPLTTTFVADSAVTTLRLQSQNGGLNGIYFDTVSVTGPTVVPEPSSIALAGFAGLAGLAFWWRRRRA